MGNGVELQPRIEFSKQNKEARALVEIGDPVKLIVYQFVILNLWVGIIGTGNPPEPRHFPCHDDLSHEGVAFEIRLY